MGHVYTAECGSAVNGTNAVCSKVDATEMILLSESERERHTPCDTAYMWNMKKGTNEPSMKQKLTHRQRADLGLPRRKGMEPRPAGSVGWTDANSYIQGGYTTRSTILLYSKPCDKP